ncbi:MAG: Asp-tRNA(Asn)/Glu-tRNA(Gln) amidotransferase subunit GatC [Candidatus Parcubacteria bacterium]|nr:Asp-tRNA(Asn)/Glu-tRNA(Gln) amidotransferase subunit GatC [Candidatus Parcubacteria bacterium]
MDIDKKQIEHLLSLARIHISEKEEKKIGQDLSQILNYINQLNEVDTENVEPMAGGSLLNNVSCEDKRNLSENDSLKLIQAAPKNDGQYIIVPPIF